MEESQELGISEAYITEIATRFQSLPNGYEVSRAEMAKEKELGNYDKVEGLGYGEIDLASFANLLCKLKIPSQAAFVDLGSGTGKAVLIAKPLFHTSCGIEIIKPLFDISIQADTGHTCKFLCASIFDHPEHWALADVLFLTCTLFSDEMMEQVDDMITQLVKPGALLMVTTRRMPNPCLRKVREERLKFAKGSMTCFVYRKLDDGINKRVKL